MDQSIAVPRRDAGTLPKHSRIFEVIDSMTQARERGEHPPLAPLFAEMQKVSSAAGVTVAQLMRRETPLGRLRQRAALATPFLIGLMTLLLTLYLAFQSSELHKADLALREYQDLVSERLQEKLYLAWKMCKYERVLNVKGPPLAQLDGYQKLVDDARRLYAKGVAVQNLLKDSSANRYVPDLFESHGPCWLRNFAATLNTTSPSPDCETAPPAAGSGAVVAAADELKEDTQDPFDCLKAQSRPIANDKPAKLQSKSDLDDYVRSITCFVRSIGITDDYAYPVDDPIYATRNKVNLLVSWLLPGLYGLLGACVFVMRDLLLVKGRGKADGDARIVDLLSLLLRVALGGLAGIIIGWFSVPTSLTAGSSEIAVSSIPFGIAFLAGFSIESLFALLDRLNRSIGQRDEKRTADVAKEPEGKA